MEKILLLGDSITQQGYATNGWVSQLADAYIRRADVINRGLSGYNSRWLLRLLQNPSSASQLLDVSRPPLFVVVFLGANDSVRSDLVQHVPVDEFESNLKKIVDLVRAALSPICGVFVITPPPIDEEKYLAFVVSNRCPTETESSRKLSRTKLYRDAVLRVAAATQSSAVDAFSRFLEGASVEDPYRPSPPWSRLLTDGLHLSEEGNSLLFTFLWEELHRNQSWAERANPETLPLVLPTWNEAASLFH